MKVVLWTISAGVLGYLYARSLNLPRCGSSLNGSRGRLGQGTEIFSPGIIRLKDCRLVFGSTNLGPILSFSIRTLA